MAGLKLRFKRHVAAFHRTALAQSLQGRELVIVQFRKRDTLGIAIKLFCPVVRLSFAGLARNPQSEQQRRRQRGICVFAMGTI